MPGARKNFFGLEGFVWYIGVVEDRNDPDLLGRVRVRCFGWHTENKELIPTDALPWAHTVFPTNLPATYTPKEGDMVFGFFMDGDSAQNPIVMGVLPGIPIAKADTTIGFNDPKGKYPKRINEPTTSRLARNRPEETIIEKRRRAQKKGIKSAGGVDWSEPTPSFAPKYPYNYAHETESGHAFELDDTPGKERVHLAHNSGTFIEMDYNGDRIEKVKKDNYTLVMGKDFVYVEGTCSVTVAGDCNLKVGGKINVEASEINMNSSGEVKIKGSKVKIESTGSMDLKSASAFNAGGGKSASISASATVTLQANKIDLAGAQVNMQAGYATPPIGTGLGSVSSLTGAAATTAANTSNTRTVVDGKTLDSKTLLNNPTFTNAMDAIGSATKDLAAGLPTGELTSSMLGFETKINSLVGDVLSLPTNQLNQVQNGAYSVYLGAKEQNIDINLSQPLIPAQQVAGKMEYEVAKQLYPKTDFILKEGG
jgi:hypothetical protein